MSSEPRLRERLDRATSRLEPDVVRHLHQALESGRRRVAVRRVGAVAGIAAAIVLIVVGGPRLLRSLPDDEVPISPGPTARPSHRSTSTARGRPRSSPDRCAPRSPTPGSASGRTA